MSGVTTAMSSRMPSAMPRFSTTKLRGLSVDEATTRAVWNWYCDHSGTSVSGSSRSSIESIAAPCSDSRMAARRASVMARRRVSSRFSSDSEK